MLRLTLFGSFRSSLHQPGPDVSFRTNKIRALLAYLVLETGRRGDGSLPREQLATLLWGNKRDKLARQNLRLAFHRLREGLDESAGEPYSQTLFEFNNQVIGIRSDHSEAIWCDVVRFRELIEQSEQHAHDDPYYCADCLQRLREAVDLYQGDLLAGITLNDAPVFDEWLMISRERLLQQVQSAYDTLVESYQRQRRYDLVREYGQRLLSIEPWRESTHRHIMIALARSGHRAAALGQYERCRSVMQQEFGTDPGPATRALADQIKQMGTLGLTSQIGPLGQEIAHPPSNLPARLTPFFGREKLSQRLIDMLNHPDQRLVTLVGPGGIGKSRLSQEVGERVRYAFRDGVWFIPLTNLTPDTRPGETETRIAALICETLDIPLSGGAPQEKLMNGLSDGYRLLILDNFEHLLAGASLLIKLLEAAPGLKLLVSSRERLSLMAERLVRITALSVPTDQGGMVENRDVWAAVPSIALFLDRAERVTGKVYGESRAERALIIHLCEILSGLPLAIELAAAGLQQLDLVGLIDEVRDSYETVSTYFIDVPRRHRSMRAVFESCWERMTDEEQIVFARCAFFRGGFDLAAGVAVTKSTMDLLSRLKEKSLIQQDSDGRYYLHELMRQFAFEKLVDLQDRGTQRRYSRYFLQFLASYNLSLNGLEPQTAVSEISAEIDNIRLGWQQAVDSHNIELIASAANPLSLFFEIRGNYRENVSIFSNAARLAEANSTSNHTLVHLMQAYQVRAEVRLANYDGALAIIEPLIPLLDYQSEPELFCMLMVSKVECLWRQGHYAESIGCIENLITIATQFDLHESIASAHYHLGTINIFYGDLESAVNYLRLAQAHWRETQNLRRLAQALNNEGVAYQTDSQPHLAQIALEEALSINEALQDAHTSLSILTNLGVIALEQGEFKHARYLWNKLLQQHAESGELYQLVIANLNIAVSYIHEEMPLLAEEHINQAIRLSNNQSPLLNARILFHQGMLAGLLDDLPAAVSLSNRASEISRTYGDAILTAQIETHRESLQAPDPIPQADPLPDIPVVPDNVSSGRPSASM